MLRKINAIFSLLVTALILDHAIFFSVWMLCRGGIAKSAAQLPWILLALTAVHAVISFVLMVLDRKGTEKRKFR